MSAPSPIRRHLLLVAVLALAGGGSSPAAETNGLAAAAPLLMGGVGGVYFLAEPGELVVEVEKRDRRPRDNRTELRAILAGPDRRVVQEATIPDDGQRRGSGLGPAQRGRLSAHVERQGVYVLTITVSNDRWGEQAVWGFRSNCPKYLIETARGHRDARHEEPIVLASPGQPADVCFLPRTGPFRIEVTGLPGSAGPLQVFDGSGAALATLAVSTNGAAAHAFTADVPRDAVPWRLHVPSAQATVAIDGVTRWDTSDRQPNLACWTPEQQSWFPLLDNRWLLTPYRQLIHGPPGQQREIAFQIRNDARRERTIQLGLEFPDGAWPAHLSAERVTLGRNKATTVTVVCTVPDAGQTRVGHLRARPLDEAGFSTYSTLTVQA
ncbi:hypothetical protein HQ590_07925, partial [bacterium]|nr:hypothetical protein [bacterium]